MSVKHLFAATFFFTGIAAVHAQAPFTSMPNMASVTNSSLDKLFDVLTTNALMALFCLMLLTGIVMVTYAWNAYDNLDKNPKNSRSTSMLIVLVLAAGLSTLGSSCTAAQQARAAQIRTAQASEGRYCTCPAPHSPGYYANAGLKNQYLHHEYSKHYGPAFCRQCGLRIVNHGH
jgi:SNF family Na+-dependent transporter